MTTYSQNGWPVDPPRSSRTIPGTKVKVTVADGPAGDVLMYVLGRIDREVEDIDLRSTMGEADDWGYANRSIRGSVSTSNHASATAVDINATRHGLGAVGTFSKSAVAKIHAILADVDHVVRWGGDYTGRRDEMHFEINASYARVAAVAKKLDSGAAAEEDDMSAAAEKQINSIYNGLYLGSHADSWKAPALAPTVGDIQSKLNSLIGLVGKQQGVTAQQLADALVPKLAAAIQPQIAAALTKVQQAGAAITADAVVAELAKDLAAGVDADNKEGATA
jgi:D-alanyl-D-alanine carboxypeptidase-like protein